MGGRKELVRKLQQDILLWQGVKPRESGQREELGLGRLEDAFPHGVFPKKAIHEFISILPEQSAASDGFIGGLLSRLMADGEACVWVSASRKLFPASLRLFNVDTERLIFVDVSNEKDVLWILEEALKCEGLAAVVAELNDLSLIESRRLQLAVEQSGVTGFILRKDGRKGLSNLASVRWNITPLPSVTEEGMPGLGFPRWKVELTKVRNGNPGQWVFEWGEEGFVEIEKAAPEKVELMQEKRSFG
jgi:protein ImuA